MQQRVLILCTGNSARSQMAEGLLRALAGEQFDVFSAGTKPSTVNPLAIAVMDERGIDIRSHHSKHLQEFLAEPFDYVITVCDNAAENCPVFPGPAQRIHWSFPDPAAVEGSETERLASFRQVRDAIEAQLRAWLASQPARQAQGIALKSDCIAAFREDYQHNESNPTNPISAHSIGRLKAFR